jgi:hypothetical protein
VARPPELGLERGRRGRPRVHEAEEVVDEDAVVRDERAAERAVVGVGVGPPRSGPDGACSGASPWSDVTVVLPTPPFGERIAIVRAA